MFESLQGHLVDFHRRIGGSFVWLKCAHLRQILQLFAHIIFDILQRFQELVHLIFDILDARLVFAELVQGIGATLHDLVDLTLNLIQDVQLIVRIRVAIHRLGIEAMPIGLEYHCTTGDLQISRAQSHNTHAAPMEASIDDVPTLDTDFIDYEDIYDISQLLLLLLLAYAIAIKQFVSQLFSSLDL